MKVTLWLAGPGFGLANLEEKTKVPGTLALPPLRMEEASCCPKLIADADGIELMVGVAAFAPCTKTVTLVVTAL
jgi:hypothetical protein